MQELKWTAQYYSILADEVTPHNTEHLVTYARFVDKDCNIREEFIGFLHIERVTGEFIANTIIKFLQDQGIPMSNMRGQGYDGTSNMSSIRVGVQGCIRQLAPQSHVRCLLFAICWSVVSIVGNIS